MEHAKAYLHLMWWLRFTEGSEAGTSDAASPVCVTELGHCRGRERKGGVNILGYIDLLITYRSAWNCGQCCQIMVGYTNSKR